MLDKICFFLDELMKSDGRVEYEKYKENFDTKELMQKNIVIGYSYQMFSRAVLRIKTNMKNCYRVEFFNYQDLSKDIKPLIKTKYEIKEKEQEKLRLITVDIIKNDEELLSLLDTLKPVLKEKLFDIYVNYSTIFGFGCCHRYEQCSDMKECLIKNSDPIFARGCQYRQNLEAGRIFYGKNRNM